MRSFALLVYAGTIFSPVAIAQSMQVIGGGSFAKECFQAANTASMTGFAGRDDVEVCDRAISYGALNKNNLVATYVNRGVIKVALEEYQGAVRDYNKALELNDESAEAYMNRGNMWFISNRFAEAIEDYDRSLALDVSKPHVAILNKGMALEGLGKLNEARSNYLAALQMVEDWPTAQSKLDRVNRKLGLTD